MRQLQTFLKKRFFFFPPLTVSRVLRTGSSFGVDIGLWFSADVSFVVGIYREQSICSSRQYIIKQIILY